VTHRTSHKQQQQQQQQRRRRRRAIDFSAKVTVSLTALSVVGRLTV